MSFSSKATFYRSAGTRRLFVFVAFVLCCLIVTFSGCALVGNDVETYYGLVKVRDAKDFRWSDGGLPQQFDPALVAAAPDTDAVRALCEGLTDYDSRNLAVIPGAAQRWESSDDYRVWTFYLRPNGRWSNDDPLTAQDFVRSWRRAAAFGDQAPHSRLLENIEGIHSTNIANNTTHQPIFQLKQSNTSNFASQRTSLIAPGETRKLKSKQRPVESSFGAEAISHDVLRVRLLRPDANFPALVAHPVFYPVHDESNIAAAAQTAEKKTSPVQRMSLITNGAFHLSAISTDGVVLERAPNYWDATEVKLQRVRFVANATAESALAAYRAGEVDAVTNAGFEPLALKMLAPYKDFRRATYGALTFYRINPAKPPFDDVRVRQALSLAIDRGRLSEDVMNGTTEPATKFLPVPLSVETKTNTDSPLPIEYNAERARRLLAAAGFPNGKGFPTVRLLINRNDQQRIVAQSVVGMWQSALGITTELIVKEWDAYEAALFAGDYDIARRGIVMQTPDEANNLRQMFETGVAASNSPPKNNSDSLLKNNKETLAHSFAQDVTTEAQALRQMPAIPLYFASSYALVKPYVSGFDPNLLDAPSLKRVRIDADWRMPKKSDAGIVTTNN